MPRAVSRRRLVVAAVLVVLAVVPNVVHVYGARYNPDPNAPLRPDTLTRPVLHVMLLGTTLFHVEASSIERAWSIGYRWKQFRGLWWLFAAVAGLVLVREFVPIPRLFGRDDD